MPVSKENMKHDVIPEDADLETLLKEKEKELKKFDMDFRPHSYWGPRNLKSYLLSAIKGEERRKLVKGFLEKFGEENLPDISLIKEKLTENERQLISRLHPNYMGGEFLPDTKEEEVEIARLVMKSVTQDVYSFRATRKKNNIVYSIENEYDSTFAHTIKTSKLPLNFKQMIKFIDEATDNDASEWPSVYGGARQYNYEEGSHEPEEYWDFETLDSAFYSQLSEWYDIQNWIWLIERKIEIIKPEVDDDAIKEHNERIKEEEYQKQKEWEEDKPYRELVEESEYQKFEEKGGRKRDGSWPSRTSWINNRDRENQIVKYVKEYYKNNNSYPKNQHIIGVKKNCNSKELIKIKVTFPD